MSESGSIVGVIPGGSGRSVRRIWSPIWRRGDVGLDLVRDVLGAGLDRQAEHELLEEAAAAHALGLAQEAQGDLGGHRDVGADPDEVDVEDVAAGRVPLDLAGEGELVVGPQAQGDERVGAAGEDVGDVAGADAHRDGLAPEPVDHGRGPRRRGGAARRGESHARRGARR